MVDNTSGEINQIKQKAKDEEYSAKNAKDIVNDAVSGMNAQRQYNTDKSQNKR